MEIESSKYYGNTVVSGRNFNILDLNNVENDNVLQNVKIDSYLQFPAMVAAFCLRSSRCIFFLNKYTKSCHNNLPNKKD